MTRGSARGPFDYTEDEWIVIGDVTKPGHDYRCEMCTQLFEVHYGRDEKPIAVTCPICGTGRTRKIMSAPALKVWWRNPLASSQASDMAPKIYSKAKNKALK